MAPPVSEARLKQIAQDACDSALGSWKAYDHGSTATWNETIINTILASLTAGEETPSYKFMVNSTIIQHSAPSSATSSAADAKDQTSDSTKATSASAGRRGMHSAAGAYWDNEQDGMWSYKYEGGEEKGMDIVVCIMWVAV